jgi:hypothetical protein
MYIDDLSDGELDYELKIRGEATDCDLAVKERTLRSRINEENCGKKIKPPTSNLPPVEDLLTCLKKTEQLVDTMKNGGEKMDKFVKHKLVSKLLHLRSRAPRIKAWDFDSMTKVNSIEGTVMGLLTQLREKKETQHRNGLQESATVLGEDDESEDEREVTVRKQSTDELEVTRQKLAEVQWELEKIRNQQLNTTVVSQESSENVRNQQTSILRSQPGTYASNYAKELARELSQKVQLNQRPVAQQQQQQTQQHHQRIQAQQQHEKDQQFQQQFSRINIQEWTSTAGNRNTDFRQPQINQRETVQQPATRGYSDTFQNQTRHTRNHTEQWHNNDTYQEGNRNGPNYDQRDEQNRWRAPRPNPDQFSSQQDNSFAQGYQNYENQYDRNYKPLPVHKWNISFSGAGGRLELLDFLEKVDIFSSIERTPKHEILRSAFHLFKGDAVRRIEKFHTTKNAEIT